jgi:hypothetical protein
MARFLGTARKESNGLGKPPGSGGDSIGPLPRNPFIGEGECFVLLRETKRAFKLFHLASNGFNSS